MTPDPIRFLHDLSFDALPEAVRAQVALNLLDLVGVGLGGATTRASSIVRGFARSQLGGALPMLFDGRAASASGVGLAGAATIDSLDGHDGYNPAKGHVGCAVFPAAFAFAHATGDMDGASFLSAITAGYEFGSRLAVALHGSVSDYHTSGAWVAVACAGLGARAFGLNRNATRHALGIAEYHGPRSQMMRCIDHPTMVKDGSGWGAMAGISAACLARDGFTGAPAITVEEAPECWSDLGTRWLSCEQYYKPYPVCRWAQGPIAGILALRTAHGLSAADVAQIEVETFHESVRLAMREPKSTDEAQYSTSFPSAVAMVRGRVTAADIADDALNDPEVLRLSRSMVMTESAFANAAFPQQRFARTRLVLKSGKVLDGDWLQPPWGPEAPPSEADLRQKFHALADPVVGAATANAIEDAVGNLPKSGLKPLSDLLIQPINSRTTAFSAS